MASKFYAGMKNVVQELNEMWAAFAAGPYNALPLTGGILSGPLITPKISNTGLLTTEFLNVGPVAAADATSNVIRIPIPNRVAGSLALVVDSCAAFFWQSGSYGITGISALDVNKNATNNRSISTGGTINASGADYAEYLIKALLCDTLVPGQIVGIDADGRLTDKWDRAIAFMVKSTNPCMVGGDSWAAHLGPRPFAPVRQDDDTDAQWAGALAAAQVAQQAFDIAIEQLRQTVDRIAFAGQVPVNVSGATPGQYIVPVQDGEGIAGAAMHLADMSMVQYANAVGKVIAIEEDGRARIIVKVA